MSKYEDLADYCWSIGEPDMANEWLEVEILLTAETARADENDRLYWELRGILDTQTARADWLQKQLDLQMGDPIARSNEDDPWNDGY